MRRAEFRSWTVASIVVVSVVLGACGNASAPSCESLQYAAPYAAPYAAEPHRLDAAGALFRRITERVPTARASVIYVVDDSSHCRNRPNGYTGKIAFVDRRITTADRYPAGAIEAGGWLEVYPSTSMVAARIQYTEELGDESPTADAHTMVVSTTILHVSHILTPDQAAEYARALL